jgi:PAS domain S-box-containing protein
MIDRTPAELVESFKFALDQAAIVAITDTAGRITYVNDYFCRIAKYSREELLGQDHRIINSGHHPKEFIKNLWETIRAGRVWKGEIRNRAKDGSLYWVDTTIVPFLDEQGRPWQYVAIRSDITDRKRAEQELASQAALVKMGEMAAVVAHEVRNPLAGIAGAVQVIGARLPVAAPERQVVTEILNRIKALNATVEDLLLFTRPRPLRPRPLALAVLLEATTSLLAKDPQAAGVRIEQHCADMALHADPEMLKPVVLNILLNAVQAMGGRGTVEVRARQEGSTCRLEVEDKGPGVPLEIRERVFEPFFTTKHRGTGLGLSIARRVVELHGGSIAIDCPPSGGTIVTLLLPLSPEVHPAGPPVAPAS